MMTGSQSKMHSHIDHKWDKEAPKILYGDGFTGAIDAKI